MPEREKRRDDDIELYTCPHFQFARRGDELHFCSIHMVRMCSGCWRLHELLHVNDPEFRRPR